MGPMEIIAAIGGGAFVLTSMFVGIRLLVVSRRTHGLPEFALGGGLLLMGGIGYPMISTAQQATGLSDAVRSGLLIGHMLCNVLGMGGIAYFTRRVFRPSELWAGLLAAFVPIVLIVGAIWQWSIGIMEFVVTKQGPWMVVTYVGAPAMLWGAFEAIHHGSLMRKRVKLSLADPVVADRMRLWGFGIGTGASIQVVFSTLEALGVEMTGATSAVFVGPMGVIASALIYLAFLPPKAYLRRVQARAAES